MTPDVRGAMAENLDQLFRLYQRELTRLAHRRLGDRDAADDVVQDAFLRFATVSQDAAAAVRNPRHFLWRIVINLVADLRRSLSRRGVHLPIDDMADRLTDPRAGPDRVLESRQLLRRLRVALDELPASCRTALLLSRVDGMSHAEVADHLGVSASMVSKYIMRGLRHCAVRLGIGASAG
jgi:RNA polymerase sigma factor (sigma-70 family)